MPTKPELPKLPGAFHPRVQEYGDACIAYGRAQGAGSAWALVDAAAEEWNDYDGKVALILDQLADALRTLKENK